MADSPRPEVSDTEEDPTAENPPAAHAPPPPPRHHHLPPPPADPSAAYAHLVRHRHHPPGLPADYYRRQMQGRSGSSSSFEHVCIKANVAVMAAAAGLDDPALLATPAGSALSSNISRAALSLGLDRQLGCSPTKYLTYAPLITADSLWGLYLYNVTATQALGGNSSRVVVESTGSLRYDLYAGRVTVNDLWTMTPFADQFWRVSAAGVSGEDLAAISRELNAHGTLSSTRGPQEHMRAVSGGTLPAYASTSEPLPGKIYELWTLSFDLPAVVRAFEAQTKRMASPKLMLDGANTTRMMQVLWMHGEPFGLTADNFPENPACFTEMIPSLCLCEPSRRTVP